MSLHQVLVINQQHVSLSLIGPIASIGNQQWSDSGRCPGIRERAVEAGGEQTLGVLEDAADLQRAGAGVDLVVQEIDDAFVREARLIFQLRETGHFSIAQILALFQPRPVPDT